MAQDKATKAQFILGGRDLEVLQKLAEGDGRTLLEELVWLIRARAFGRLKDLGDDRINPLVSASDLSERLYVKSLRLEREPDEFGPPNS